MPATEHSLITALRTLKLPANDFVVFGSGPLLNHGIRTDITDIDVLARGKAWVTAGLLADTVTLSPRTGTPILAFWCGRIEICDRWISPKYDIDAIIDGADVVDDIRYARLDQVLRYKMDMNRPKDQADIDAIRALIDKEGSGTSTMEPQGTAMPNERTDLHSAFDELSIPA
ncbi:hypothetical protein [Stackebrandtia soli]|uniref:hypothetical protein n=1 Tax=Stackebrandtia soli TaxID=1892856 RepID=UPI0039E92001